MHCGSQLNFCLLILGETGVICFLLCFSIIFYILNPTKKQKCLQANNHFQYSHFQYNGLLTIKMAAVFLVCLASKGSNHCMFAQFDDTLDHVSKQT